MNKDEQMSGLVSILLPTYNRANLLEQCVGSVLAQTYSNWELIISDDGSTDDTTLVAKKIMEKDIRIRYHRNSVHQGTPKNRNIAVSISKGNLLFFIADNITLEPKCLEILVKTFKELENEDKVGAIAPRMLGEGRKGKNLLDKALRYVGDYKRKGMNIPCKFNPLTGIILRNFGIELDDVQEVVEIHGCSLYSRSIFEIIGGYEEMYKGNYNCEESDFNFRIKNKGYKLYYQSKATLYHEATDIGGWHDISPIKHYYYFLRNHILFMLKIFKVKSVYMFPLFLLSIAFYSIEYGLLRLITGNRDK